MVTQEEVKMPPPDGPGTARYMAAKLWAARWKVVPHHALPKWLQDNDYLLTGNVTDRERGSGVGGIFF